MITAGEGPIPLDILARSDCTEIEDALLDLPVIGEALLKTEVPNPGSFIELGRRGIFVYDWRDTHRPNSIVHKAYELMCSPTIRIHREDLPRNLFDLTYKIDTMFGDTPIRAVGWFDPKHL